MDNNGSKLNDKSELPTELELENTVDTERNVVCSGVAIRRSGCWYHNLPRRQ